MPITYTILDNFQCIGECQGLPDSDTQGNYILIQPEMYGLVNVGNVLVSPANEHLDLYFQDPVIRDGQLVAVKMYYH